MIKLFLPVLFPSWRFFSSIGPSPRIHIAFLKNEDDEPESWQEFRPRPASVSVWKGFLRLFHNPQWNETLYINTCAERLFEGYAEIREREIMQRVCAAVTSGEISNDTGARYVTYRISAVIREGKIIRQPITFVAQPMLLKDVV